MYHFTERGWNLTQRATLYLNDEISNAGGKTWILATCYHRLLTVDHEEAALNASLKMSVNFG